MRLLNIPAGLLLAVAICYMYVNGAAQESGDFQRLDGSRIKHHRADSTIQSLMQAGKVEGLALAIINGNKPVYVKTFGLKDEPGGALIDTATVLYAASFSKAVFAYLSLMLVQEGLLDLDRPLYRYLSKPIPEYKDYEELKGDDHWKNITARMCLSHTTGLPNSRWINVHTGEQDTTGTMKIYFQPGTRYAYSGEGLKLLQLAEEEVTGKGLEELALEKIFKPAGMVRSGYVWHTRFDSNYAIGHDEQGKLHPKKPRNKPVASGSLVTTIADYARFISYVVQHKGLNRQLWNEMVRPQIAIRATYQFPTIIDDSTHDNDAIQLSYGLGWGLLQSPYGKAFFKEGHDFAWHNYNINFPERKLSIIIMSNSGHGEGIFKPLLEALIGDVYTPWKWQRYVPYNYPAK